MVHSRNGVLEELGFLWNERAKVSGDRPHVAMRKLVPRLGESIRELLRMLKPALGDRAIDRVHSQREVRREHYRAMPLRPIVGIRNGARCSPVLGNPLVLTGGALGELPFIAVQVFEKVVVPLYRVGGPGTLQAAGESVPAFAAAIAIFPTQALLFDGGGLRFAADIAFRTSTVGFSERVPASDKRRCLHVIHRHAAEGLTDIECRSEW